jgi:tetratricopeptide (TPR) repeat protein
MLVKSLKSPTNHLIGRFSNKDGKTDKPDCFPKKRIGLISFFFIFIRLRNFLIISSLFLFTGYASAQCPDRIFFRDKIMSVFNAVSGKTEDQLKILLLVKKQMEECHLEQDSTYMFLVQKIGLLYFRQSDYPAAILNTRESIRIAKYCLENHTGNELPLVRSYANLDYFYKASGELKQKYEAVDSCLAYALKGKTGFELALEPLSDKANYLFNTGEYSLCGRDAKLGEDIVEEYYHGDDSIRLIVFFVTMRANALYFSSDIDTAEKLLESKILLFKNAGNKNYLGSFFNLLGLINRSKGDYTTALSYFQKAYQADHNLKYNGGCAQDLATIGMLYAKVYGDYKTSLSYCSRALPYADAMDSLFIFQQTGNIYVLQGKYDSAQIYFQRAFNTIQKGMNETTILRNSFQFPGFNLLQTLSDLITDKGDAYMKQYDQTKENRFLQTALGIYKKNDLFLAKIKTDQQLQINSSLVWRTTARHLYEHALEACHTGNKLEDAFYFFEKSRAVLLNDQINEQRFTANEDIARLSVLKKSILELERKLEAVQVSSEEYLTIQKNLFNRSQELEVLTRNIRNKYPAFYQNHLDTTFLTVSQLRQNILDKSGSFVEIFSGDSAVYELIITHEIQSFSKLDKKLYDSLTNSFNSFVSDLYKLQVNFAGFVKVSNRLFKLLFQNRIPPDGKLIISPDGINYPFEALAMTVSNRNPDYLLNHYATSYTYSVKYLTNKFAEDEKGGDSVLGFAPVHYKSYPDLSELPGSDASLKKINDYFPDAENYTFGNATKNNFLQSFPGYGIIQLYTHAASSSDHNEPVIYFTDSALYLSDLIPDRKVATQLVILSACETGNGRFYKGEGIFSFNRGFAALGIPEAVSNLWSVENESTYRNTELFYKYLSQGLPTDVALQKAKIEFMHSASMEKKKLPYFWASSILTGKVNSIKINSRISIVKWIAIGVLLFLIGFYFRKILNKNALRGWAGK